MAIVQIENLKTVVNELIETSIAQMKEQIEQQGHNATKALSNNITAKSEKTSDGIEIKVEMFLYGAYVNKGVSAARFRFGGQAHIDSLVEWAKVKGIKVTDGNYESFAWAVVKKHKKEGMPTKSSYSFSNNGKRLGFVDDAAVAVSVIVERYLNNNLQISIELQ